MIVWLYMVGIQIPLAIIVHVQLKYCSRLARGCCENHCCFACVFWCGYCSKPAQHAPAPISLQFLSPHLPLLLFAPNQNHLALQVSIVSVFRIFFTLSFGDCTYPQHQKTTRLKDTKIPTLSQINNIVNPKINS